MRLRYFLLLLVLLLPATLRAQEAPTSPFVTASPQALQLFLQLTGIEGEAIQKAHEKWIEVDAYAHELTNTIMTSGGGGTTSKPQHSPITLTKRMDTSSPGLIKALNEGRHIEAATFEFIDGATGVKRLKVELEDVIVVAYSVTGYAEGSDLYENVSLLYRKITWTYTPIVRGYPGTPIVTSYDAATNTSNVVALASFEAVALDDAVVFTWRTLSEDANYGFELQHWEAGDFRRAAYVPGAGWSQKALEYEVRIRGLEKGIHVFRLATLGLDGSVAYSEEVDVALGVPEGQDLIVEAPYPNPFTREASVSVAVARPMDARVTLCDLLGREVAVVYEGMLEPGGAVRLAVTPDEGLPAGLYALRVETARGVQTRLLTRVR